MATNSTRSAEDCAARLLEIIPAVMRTIRARMRQQASVELSVVQFRALARSVRTRGASVSEIAEHVGLTLPSASKLIHGLVRRRYLRRTAHARDRRICVLAATPKGVQALEAARRAARRHLAGMLQGLSHRQFERIAGVMDDLRPIFLDMVMTGASSVRKSPVGRSNT
jgi:DNA-binding MarR family transcriptional regulator